MSMMHHFSGLLNTKVNMKLHSQPILFYNVKYFRVKRTSVDWIFKRCSNVSEMFGWERVEKKTDW